MKHLLCFSLFALGLAFAAPALAAIEGGTGDIPVGLPAGPTTTGGQCDYTAIKDSLYKTESAGSGAYLADGGDSDYGRVRGKYQFVDETQTTMLNRYPECAGGHDCHHDNIWKTECHPAQECLMDRLVAENIARAKQKETCQALVGTQISATHPKRAACGPKQVTWSGVAAAMHLGGDDACSNVVNDGVGDRDRHGTSEAYYMCEHSGHPIPEQCELPTPEPGSTAPTLTLIQIETLIDQGDQDYISTGTIKTNWVAGLMLMAEQFSVNMVKQLEAIGMFFDAKEQLETQRDFQQRVAEAHRDYHPSEQMCTFGSFATNLASTDRRADLTRSTLSKQVLQRELGSGESQAISIETDILSRLKQFRSTFCNKTDNGDGLNNLCKHETESHMQNRDIDYTGSVDKPLTLDINLTDSDVTDDEQAVFALIDNLFAHAPLPRLNANSFKDNPAEQIGYRHHYMNLRSIVAMRGIARNSMSNIIALKSASPDQAERSGPYLKALMKEMGLPDEEVEKILGENPSYYAQMEFLSKKIYQNPNFYTALYDKPANVERIRAAMNAVKLMNDRDIHAAMLRREMLLSMMLELRLRERADVVYRDTGNAIFRSR